MVLQVSTSTYHRRPGDKTVLSLIKQSREQDYIINGHFRSIIDTIVMCNIILTNIFSSKIFYDG